MTNAMAVAEVGHDTLEKVMLSGDLSRLAPAQRVEYYGATCRSLGLNPLTRPFDYITLNGKLTLYARKDTTEQLRKIHGVSIERLERELVEDTYLVTAYARDKEGRTDSAIGAVAVGGLKGEARANAMMKAETKAKRRVTLSICGLGWMDETEARTVPEAAAVEVDLNTGEIGKASVIPADTKTVIVETSTGEEIEQEVVEEEEPFESEESEPKPLDPRIAARSKDGVTYYGMAKDDAEAGAPDCPICGKRMADTMADALKVMEQKKKPYPIFKCSDQKCARMGGVVWLNRKPKS